MKTFIRTLLPSGKALSLQKLGTRDYKRALERVAGKVKTDNETLFGMKLADELLVSAFRGITLAPVAPVLAGGEGSDVDVDATIESVPDESWLKPTYQDLITEGDRNIFELLNDPEDYNTALGITQRYVLGAGQSAFAGKVKLVSVES